MKVLPMKGLLSCCPRLNSQAGVTLIELVIAMAILAILASAVIPMAEVNVRRSKELELRQALRILRSAIDAYKEDFDQAKLQNRIIVSITVSGYPESLEILVEGTDWGGLYPYKKKYLRRIPADPFDPDELGWGLRSYEDDPDSSVWGGTDVYDVYTQNEGLGLDGTPRNRW